MILIADSGSTKTDWCVVENGVLLQQIFTKGTNPFFQSEEEISNEIATALLPQLKTSELDAVYFYGAGCGFPDKISMVHRAITKHLSVKMKWKSIPICWLPHVASADMTQALPASWGPAPTHVIMTEKHCHQCISSGIHLGRRRQRSLLGQTVGRRYLENQMTPELKEKFLKQFDLTPADIIDRVYRKPFPNRFLASLSPFLHRIWVNLVYALWY